MHPLVDNLETLTTNELEAKITDLTKKYFLTRNAELQIQILNILDSYKNELDTRRRAEWKKVQENRDKGLDKLIKID